MGKHRLSLFTDSGCSWALIMPMAQKASRHEISHTTFKITVGTFFAVNKIPLLHFILKRERSITKLSCLMSWCTCLMLISQSKVAINKYTMVTTGWSWANNQLFFPVNIMNTSKSKVFWKKEQCWYLNKQKTDFFLHAYTHNSEIWDSPKWFKGIFFS